MTGYSKSLLLIWQIAELEALHLRQKTIRPSHFFLGILKIVEIDLDKLLSAQKQDFSKEIKQDVLDLKNCVGEFVLDFTYTRRFLRGILPKGEEGSRPVEKHLHRTPIARLVFSEAALLAKKTNSPVLPTHLLMALLESKDIQISAALEKIQIDIDDFKKYIINYIAKSRKSPKSL